MVIEGANGLRLVCSSTGRAWVCRYKDATGRMKQIKLGQWPAMSVSQAVGDVERLRRERAAGRDPVQARKAARIERVQAARPSAGPYTVARLLADFVPIASKSRKPKGARELARTLATMTGEIADMLPADVTRSVACALISSYADTPVQAGALRRELGSAWEWGHDSVRLSDDIPNRWWQILRGKLASKGKIVNGEHQGVVKRVLSLAEVGALLRHLPHVSRLIRIC